MTSLPRIFVCVIAYVLMYQCVTTRVRDFSWRRWRNKLYMYSYVQGAVHQTKTKEEAETNVVPCPRNFSVFQPADAWIRGRGLSSYFATNTGTDHCSVTLPQVLLAAINEKRHASGVDWAMNCSLCTLSDVLYTIVCIRLFSVRAAVGNQTGNVAKRTKKKETESRSHLRLPLTPYTV